MSLALSSDITETGSVLVNMRQMATQLRTTRQTISAWLDKWPDFPIEVRGTNGAQYRFDATKVYAFLRERKDEQARSSAARDQALAQLAFPFEDEADVPSPGLSIKDQIEAFKLRKMQREEAERSGQLVEVAAISDLLATCFQSLNRSMHTAIRQAAREHNLPDAVMRSLDNKLAEAQRAFVRETRASLAEMPQDE